jgi:hypothetical protein
MVFSAQPYDYTLLSIKLPLQGWYDFGTIYIQNRSILFNYFQLET